MPDVIDPSQALANPKDEMFAQGVAAGKTALDAFQNSHGYRDTGNASRKANQRLIKQRVKYLRGYVVVTPARVVEGCTAVGCEEATKSASDDFGAEQVTRDFVLANLKRNVQIAMGDLPVKMLVMPKGGVRPVEVHVTMRDASAANKALELLGRELGMWEGDMKPKAEGLNPQEKGPIVVGSKEAVIAFLKRIAEGKTPAALIGAAIRRKNEEHQAAIDAKVAGDGENFGSPHGW